MKKLLVVDDTPEVRNVIERMLVERGFEVLIARNGREALDLLGYGSFDAVLLDVWMPKMNGLGLLQTIRTMGFAGKVIMISGDTNPVMALHTMELGACDFLNKPINFSQLNESLEYHCA